MEGLSKRQKEVYDFIEQYHAKHDIAPSIDDIACGLGLGNSTIATYIENLKKKGYVTNISRRPRTLRIVKQAAQLRRFINEKLQRIHHISARLHRCH